MRLACRRSHIEVSKYFIILQLVVIKFWLPTTLDSQGGGDTVRWRGTLERGIREGGMTGKGGLRERRKNKMEKREYYNS